MKMEQIGGWREMLMMMKLWIDDIRPAPDGFIWCKSVNQAKAAITAYEHQYSCDNILIDLDNDAADYFKILDWLEEKNIVDTGYFFKIHSKNPVGIMKMEDIIRHNGWRLVL